MEATLAKNLETERKGERFTLIEPPMAPEEPVSPNRLAIVLLGLVLVVRRRASAWCCCSKRVDTSIRSRRDIEALIAVPPLAVLPWIETPAERAGKTKVRRLSLAGAASSVVLAVIMVHFFIVRSTCSGPWRGAASSVEVIRVERTTPEPWN